MKILYIAPYLPYPQDEGGKIRIFNLIKYLSLSNNQIHYLSLIYSNKEIELLEHLKPYCEKIEVALHSPPPRNSSLIAKTKRALFEPPDLITKRYNAELELLVKKYIENNNYDIICAEQLYSAQYLIPYLNKNSKTKFVISEHNIESEIFNRYVNTRGTTGDLQISKWWLRNRLEVEKLKKYESGIWNSVKNILVVSERDQDVINNIVSGCNISVIPNGVDFEAFNTDYKPSDYEIKKINLPERKNFSLVYTGSFTHYPNTDAIIFFYHNVFLNLKKHIPDIRLYVVGKNPYPDLIKLNEDENVTVTGYVDDVRPYVYNCDIFITPLRIGGGSRLKILQAMGMAKCVVSTSIGAEGIVCENNKNIVIADTPSEILDSIIRLFKNKNLSDEIGADAFRLVSEKYSWQSITDKLSYYFNQLIV